MAEDEALKKLQTRNAYLEKERIELRQQVQRMEKDETTREAVIRAMETENTRLLKDVKGLRDKVGQLTYDLGVVTRRGSVSSRPRDSPLPEIPQEDTETRVFQIETTEEESSGGYAKITNAVGRIAEDSGSEEDKSPNFEEEPDLKPPDSPRRKRTLTMDDIHVRLESPESGFLDAPQSRSRVHTVGNGLGLVDQWKRSHSRGVSTSGIPSLRPVIIPHKKTSKSARDHGRSYPIAPYMEEKIRKKIREEIGKKYGGLERVTKAAVAIQRWYNDACRRRHWKMLQGMAANQPKKLRQRTKSMRQSGYRPRGYTVSAEPVANGGRHAMKKYASILEEFPQYKSIAEKCGTPRTRRKKSSNTADSTNSLPGSPMVEQASIQFPPSEPDQEPKPNHKPPQQEPKPLDRKPTVKKMTIQSSSSEDSTHREGGSLSPGVDSGIYNNSPPPGEEGLSIVGESRLEKISEFRVVDSQTAFLKGERESATTMRRKINIGINYFNRKPWKGLVYLVQRRVLEDSPGKIASFFISRVDLSKEKIGEFLGDIQSEFCQAVLEEMVLLMNFQKKTVDEALRVFQAHFLMPGEAQKIEKIVEVFANGYYEANKGADEELKSVFDSSDAIFVLSYAIMMLNTDLHNPNVRRHLTRLEWLKMNKGINGGGDFPAEFLIGVYNRILRSPFMPAQDHTHDVDSIEKSIIGCPKLVQTHRRLLYKCRVMELEGDAQKPRPKFLFVFNDLLLVTKPRARDYQFKAMIPLMGANIVKFESMGAGNKCGVDLHNTEGGVHQHLMCSCEDGLVRTKLMKYLGDAIAELEEMDRERILAGEQSVAGSGSVRLSPSNLSAMEAPELSCSQKSDYSQGSSEGMLRSGSVPDIVFALSQSQEILRSGPAPLSPSPAPLPSADSHHTLNSLDSEDSSYRHSNVDSPTNMYGRGGVPSPTPPTEDVDGGGVVRAAAGERRPHSVSISDTHRVTSSPSKDLARLSASLDPLGSTKSLDRRGSAGKNPHPRSTTPTNSPSKFKFWKKKATRTPTSPSTTSTSEGTNL